MANTCQVKLPKYVTMKRRIYSPPCEVYSDLQENSFFLAIHTPIHVQENQIVFLKEIPTYICI